MREVFRMVESSTIYVVPLFISEGYFTRTVIPRELELEGAHTRREGRMIHCCDPVGSHPRMTEVLLRRAREVAPNYAERSPQASSSSDMAPTSMTILPVLRKSRRQGIRSLGDYAQVISAYMEEPPLIADWANLSEPVRTS